MKYFVLLSSRMKQYYQSGKSVFCIFIIGSLLLNLLMIFMYGNTVTYMKSKNMNTLDYCKYSVILNGSDYQNLCGQLDQLLQDKNMKDIFFYSYWEDGQETFFFITSKDNDAGLQWQKLKGRISFSEAEIENRTKCVIAPREWGLKPGDKKGFGELGEFEVVGVGTLWQGGYIPSTVFESMPLPVMSIDILLTERLSAEAHQQFMDLLSAAYGRENVIPAYGISDDMRNSPNDMIGLSILYIFTAAAFLFLLQYITVLNRKMDAVSELVGATKGTVAFFLLLERFCIALAAAVGGIVIHRVFYDSVFQRFNLTGIDYEWRDYGIIAAIIVLSSLLASIPFVISYARKSAMRIFTE